MGIGQQMGTCFQGYDEHYPIDLDISDQSTQFSFIAAGRRAFEALGRLATTQWL